MAENSAGVIDRRHFLYKGTAFFAASLVGLNSFSRVFASDNPQPQPRIALIIDDIGFSRSRLRQFLELQTPMTFAVLPRLKNSHKLALEIHAHGHEIMLHQPMEPYARDLDPGPGAIYVGDEPNRIAGILRENISDIPFVTGVNNHMGSRFTSSRKGMGDALRTINKKGLFFVDSVTTSRSIGYKTAKRLHMAAAFRNIFLDNCSEETAILSQLHKLKAHALRFGHAIGIGHPFPETASAIRHFLTDLRGSDISMVHISHLIRT